MVKIFRKEIWLSFQKDPSMSLELYTLENFSLKNKQNAPRFECISSCSSLNGVEVQLVATLWNNASLSTVGFITASSHSSLLQDKSS